MADDVAFIILAAGASRRLGQPKQLVRLDGRPLLQHVVDTVAAAGRPTVLVLGHHADHIRASIRTPSNVTVAVISDPAAGQSASLHTGLDALPATVQRAVVVLGDQPAVTGAALTAVASAAGPLAQAVYDDGPGHPVALDRSFWPEVRQVRGDRGARDVLRRHATRVTRVPIPGDAPRDVDTPQDLHALGIDSPNEKQ